MRLVLRAPLWLYRARLGWLLGSRFICLVHRGRRSGRLHRAVLEVVHFDRERPELAVIAGWGPRTQWYRNLERAPAEQVTLGRRRWRRPAQRFPDEPERVELLRAYAREHPLAARELARACGAEGMDDDEIARLAERTRAVAFRPAR